MIHIQKMFFYIDMKEKEFWMNLDKKHIDYNYYYYNKYYDKKIAYLYYYYLSFLNQNNIIYIL